MQEEIEITSLVGLQDTVLKQPGVSTYRQLPMGRIFFAGFKTGL